MNVKGEYTLSPKEVIQRKLKRYRRLRWGVTFVFVVGLGLSMLLQVLHAPEQGGWVAMVIGGFPPFAVFLCIEIISRIPIMQKLNAWARVIIALGVTGLAMWQSYEQQYAYVSGLGFTGSEAAKFPFIIDGVLFVATLSLVEVSRAIRDLTEEYLTTEVSSDIPAPQPVQEEKPKVEPVTKPTYAPTGKRGRKPGPQEPSHRRRMPKQRTESSGIKQRPQVTFSNAPSEREPIEAIVISDDAPALPPAMEESVHDLVAESSADK